MYPNIHISIKVLIHGHNIPTFLFLTQPSSQPTTKPTSLTKGTNTAVLDLYKGSLVDAVRSGSLGLVVSPCITYIQKQMHMYFCLSFLFLDLPVRNLDCRVFSGILLKYLILLATKD
jgi:hypothetical protein